MVSVVADEGEVGMIVMSRLNAFLPAMEAANKDLQAEIEDGTIGERNIEVLDGEEEERYIEMVSEGVGVCPVPGRANERRTGRQNLGLGVLEEKKDGDSGDESEEVEEEAEDDDDDDEERDHDILLKLVNSSKRHGKGPRGKPSIEVVEHSQDTPTPEKQAAHPHHHTGTEGK